MLSFFASPTFVAISRSFLLDSRLAALVVPGRTLSAPAVLALKLFGNVIVTGMLRLQFPLGLPSVSTDVVFVYIGEVRFPLLQKFSVILGAL